MRHVLAALKKKKKGTGSDDLFSTEDDSLFGDGGDLLGASEATKAKKPSAAPDERSADTGKKLRGKLNTEQRLERFNTLFEFGNSFPTVCRAEIRSIH